jgi:predicted dehydrogenase
MKKVKWGVLSTAKIGLDKVIPAMQASAWCEIAAIASRSPEQARAAADRLGIPTAYGSYEALLADPEIEAIYNPLPNHLHVAWTLAAARAGKHVLCEKPFAMSAADALALRALDPAVLVMEAFMVRFHPQWLRARALVQQGALGELRVVQAYFSYFNRQPGNIRNRSDAGGGALYDIGCYAVVAGRFFFGAEPLRAIALFDRDPEFGTDRLCSALVDFGAGRRLDFTVSTQTTPYQRLHLVGTRQRLEMEIPFNAPQGAAARIWLDDGRVPGARQALCEDLPPADQYTLQGDAFAQAVRGVAALPYGRADAECNLRVIDALFASEQTGAWVAVAPA